MMYVQFPDHVGSVAETYDCTFKGIMTHIYTSPWQLLNFIELFLHNKTRFDSRLYCCLPCFIVFVTSHTHTHTFSHSLLWKQINNNVFNFKRILNQSANYTMIIDRVNFFSGV